MFDVVIGGNIFSVPFCLRFDSLDKSQKLFYIQRQKYATIYNLKYGEKINWSYLKFEMFKQIFTYYFVKVF